MTTVEKNRALLRHWYDHMWGCTNFDLIPEIAAEKYLRHDITGANNLMPATAYRDMLKPVLGHLEVQEFQYHLTCEGDYVGALGRFILPGDKQWDWVQLFRVENNHLVETWLAGMGGTDPMGYPHPRNAWHGGEIPSVALPPSKNKTLVTSWLNNFLGESCDPNAFLLPEIRVHDFIHSDRIVSAVEYQSQWLALMNSQQISDFQSFVIGEGDMVFATCSWKLDGDRQWDWVQAFQIINGKIARIWLPVIGGTDTDLNLGAQTRWSASVMPADSIALPVD
ncbi:hypothetical protein [Halioxenophilus sp. WMMB6]|uniref:hypothetical protein n=1 Tax=Halioxenophilus sp. WMMB6 TaxID=3073815 RepID=UPI00295F491C|nr:hypothetical protein [Halioxenophilus sp. WMMB6]